VTGRLSRGAAAIYLKKYLQFANNTRSLRQSYQYVLAALKVNNAGSLR
jgi:hypothetical protein